MPWEKVNKEKIILSVLESAFVNSTGATSLADISGKLGIKKASLYNHYSSRQEMIEDTIKFCANHLKKLTFIPLNIKDTVSKYNATVVFKAIVHRWVKLFETEPLILIYSFIESEKYFNNEVLKIKLEEKNKILEQTKIVLRTLNEMKKITFIEGEQLNLKAQIFSETVNSILDNLILEKKKFIRENPKSGNGELFNLPSESNSDFSNIDKIIESFCNSLKD